MWVRKQYLTRRLLAALLSSEDVHVTLTLIQGWPPSREHPLPAPDAAFRFNLPPSCDRPLPAPDAAAPPNLPPAAAIYRRRHLAVMSPEHKGLQVHAEEDEDEFDAPTEGALAQLKRQYQQVSAGTRVVWGGKCGWVWTECGTGKAGKAGSWPLK